MSTALRVLEVFDPPDGGVAEHVRLLSEGLVARGHEVTVAGPASGAPRAQLEARGVRYVELPIVSDMLALDHDVPTVRAIGSLIRRERFHLVHGHSQKSGLLVRTAAPPLRTPAVYTPHLLIHRFMFVRAYPRARSRYYKTLWMERILGRVTAAFIAVAEDERRAALEDRLVPRSRVHTIRNGIPFDAAGAPDPTLLRFRGEGPLLGFVAGLREQKGLPTLLDALELLAARGDAPRFAIVGNGPLGDDVRRRVAEGPLAQTTLVSAFEGGVEPYLGALDAFVLPSYYEGLPLAVLEAMAAGLPVVATAVGGTPEAVIEGETGLLVPGGDAEALAERIARMASDEQLRLRLGAAGHARWQECFGVDRMIEATAALYEQVASRRRAARD